MKVNFENYWKHLSDDLTNIKAMHKACTDILTNEGLTYNQLSELENCFHEDYNLNNF